MKELLKRSLQLVRSGKRPTATVPSDLPEGAELDRKGKIRIPRTPAACADLLYRTREERLSLQRQLDKMQALELALKNFFIDTLPKSKATGIAGRVARVQILPHSIPVVEDWTKFYSFVRRNNAFELLQRRLSETAVKERFDEGKGLPGVSVFNTKKVSVTRI